MVDDYDKKSKFEKPKIMQISANPQVTDLIGQRLRSFYDDAAGRPVPDRFLDLLKQLEAAEQNPKSHDGDPSD